MPRNLLQSSVAVSEGPIGVATVVLRGLEDGAVLAGVAEELRGLTLPERIIIDLSEVTLVDHAVVEVLANSVLGPAAEGRRLSLVCRRLSGCRLLRAWSDDSISVCRSVTEAQRQLSLPKADPGRPVKQAGSARPRPTGAGAWRGSPASDDGWRRVTPGRSRTPGV